MQAEAPDRETIAYHEAGHAVAHYVLGRQLSMLSIKPADEGMLRDLFYSLTDESIYLRYFSNVRAMAREPSNPIRMSVVSVSSTSTPGAVALPWL